MTTTTQLRELLWLGESQHVELKSDYRDLNRIGQAVCGFLNTSGGTLVCGVGYKGEILGVDGSDSTVKEFEQRLQTRLSPKALVSVQVQEVEGKALLVIEAPAGKDLPYAFEDVIYLRTDHTTRKADVETIKDMVMRKQVEPERWERRFSFADLEQDTDMEEVRSAVTAIKQAQRAFFRDAEDPIRALEDLSAAKYGRLTNAGDVLFGRNAAQRYPQIRVRAACFTENKASNTFRDMKSFEGPLVPVLEQAFEFIVRNTPTLSTFSSSSLQRRDESFYPTEAIREALVNAFAHRDYSDSSGGITINVYPARLEIWNSGGLPEGITPQTLIGGHLSVLRNPDIAHVLYLRGLMEKLGRGSVLILQACKDRGLPEPKWTSAEKTGVTLTFFTTDVTTDVTTEVTTEVKRMLEVLDGEMSRHELQRHLGLKNDEHFRKAYLQPAITESLIEMTLPDKPRSSKQRYRLTRKGRSILGNDRA